MTNEKHKIPGKPCILDMFLKGGIAKFVMIWLKFWNHFWEKTFKVIWLKFCLEALVYRQKSNRCIDLREFPVLYRKW